MCTESLSLSPSLISPILVQRHNSYASQNKIYPPPDHLRKQKPQQVEEMSHELLVQLKKDPSYQQPISATTKHLKGKKI